LQIEDYRTAADYLLEAQKQYKEQGFEQEAKIRELQFKTSELEAWREALKAAREQDQELKTRNVLNTRRLDEQRAYVKILGQRKDHLTQCENQRNQSERDKTYAQQQCTQAEKELDEARTAHQAVEESLADHERYQIAEKELAKLRQDERQRNELRQQQAKINNTISITETNINNLQHHLDEIALAHQRVLELLPAVERQSELNTQIGTLALEVQRYNALRDEGTRIYRLREKSQREQDAARQRIAEIAPLQPLADQLNERQVRLTQLQMQHEQRQAKRLQLEEKQQLLQ
jgi:exonuclease SbcC